MERRLLLRYPKGSAKSLTLFICVPKRWGGQVRGSKFIGYVYFRKARFSGNASFGGSKFYGNVHFRRARFSGDANFKWIQISGYAGFGKVQFRGDANFRWAQFSDDANFEETRFCGNVDFREARFRSDVTFKLVRFDRELKLDNLKFGRLYITWKSIRYNLVYDGPIYVDLIKYFRLIERLSDADDCYYSYRKESQNHKKFHDKECGLDWSKLLDIIAWISCGYGVRPLHTLVCMIGVVFISWIIFLGCFDSLFESFYFSLMTFTGGEPGNLSPERWLRTVAMIEAIFGYLFLALFVVVLARKLIW